MREQKHIILKNGRTKFADAGLEGPDGLERKSKINFCAQLFWRDFARFRGSQSAQIDRLPIEINSARRN